MKLISISLQNYRQFYEENTLTFSTDKNKSITVIHGENGSGKTSILNGFKWCFYDHVDFDTGTENLVNEQAIATASEGDDIKLSVIVKFEHDGMIHTVKRVQLYKKSSGHQITKLGSANLSLEWIEKETGERKESSNPATHIGKILPESLHSYFFFNGERIEKLANSSGSKDIRHAIKSIMGLEVIEKAKTHLSKYVNKEFKKQLKSNSHKDLKVAIDLENSLLDKESNIQLEIDESNNTKVQLENNIEEVNTRIEGIKDTAILQQRRNEISNRLKGIKDELIHSRSELSTLISTRGFLAFFNDTADRTSEILDNKRQKGELPYKIKSQFIDDLISDGNCICGNVVTIGSDAEKNLLKYKQNSTSKSLEDAFINVSGSLGFIKSHRSDFFSRIQRIQDIRIKLNKERRELVGELETISSNVLVVEEAAELESQRNELLDLRDQEIEKIGQLKKELENISDEIKEAKENRIRLSENEQKHSLINRRLKTSEECHSVMSKLLDVISDSVRKKLSDSVNKTFQNIIRKSYWAEIDSDYSLQIYKDVPGVGKQVVNEKSTGESQITSLSFIACIVNLAKENEDNPSGLVQGGYFPIVMDSPFGALDDEYRTLIAKNIPVLADQIIIFASSSQWQGAVAKECEDRVGRHNSLVYYKPGLDENESDYVKSSSDFERTVISEGHYG